MPPGDETAAPELPAGWNPPLPARLPEPTYWPAVLALGLVAVLFGVLTSIVFSAVGLLVSVAALVGWIGGLRHDGGTGAP